MHLVRSGLVIAFVIPWVLAGPREKSILRRTGDDDTSKDVGSSVTSSSALSTSPSVSIPFSTPAKDQSSSTLPKDQTSAAPANDKTSTSILPSGTAVNFSSSVLDKGSSSDASVSIQTAPGLQSISQTTSASSSPGLTESSTILSFPLGTGVSPAAGSTVDVATTEIVYTTLTTCPVTSTAISGSNSIQEVTTTVSTVTRTSISTICTKCVAPPKTSLVLSSSLPFSTPPASSVPSSFTAPSAGFSIPSSKPEISSIGTASSFSVGFGFPTAVSLTVSATLGTSSSLQIPGFSIVPSPTSVFGSNGPLSNASSSILPVFTPSLLGNGYGGGFVSTPSIFVTRLSAPFGPSQGVPPGYGYSSKPETSSISVLGQQQSGTVVENVTSPLTGVGIPTTTAFSFINTTASFDSAPASPNLLSTFPTPVASIAKGNFTANIATTSGVPGVTVSALIGGSTVVTVLPSLVSLTPSESSIEAFANGNSTVGIAGTSATPGQTSSALIGGSTVVTGLPSLRPLSPSESSIEGFIASPSLSGISNLGSAVSSATPVILFTSSANNGSVIIGVSTLLPSAIAASTGQAVVEVSSPLPAPITSTASNGQLIVGTSTPSPITISSTATNSQVIPGTSTPLPTPVSSTALNGQVTVVSSTPLPVFLSSTISSGEVIVGISTPLPVPATSTATSGQVIVGTTIPSPIFVAAAASNGTESLESPSPVLVLVSSTASNGAVIVETSTSTLPSGFSIAQTSAGAPVIALSGSFGEVLFAASTPTSLGITDSIGNVINETPPISPIASVIGTPVVIGAVGSPVSASQQVPVTPITLSASPSEQQVPSSIQGSPTVLTPVVGANGLTSLAAISLPGEQASSAGLPAATVLTPIAGLNGLTSLAVVPTPIVGANGLTSLAVFSAPIEAGSGLISPAVVLTPAVGANGLTSLAVLATPVVGANGQTSLAVGLEAGQSTPSPVAGFIPATSDVAGLGVQPGLPTSPIVVPTGSSGFPLPSISSTPSLGSGSNSSVHVPLNPSSMTQFEASGLKLTISFGLSLLGLFVFLLLL
ncbi:hypothetical protein ACLMJK_000080 [Lecanora helva]